MWLNKFYLLIRISSNFKIEHKFKWFKFLIIKFNYRIKFVLSLDFSYYLNLNLILSKWNLECKTKCKTNNLLFLILSDENALQIYIPNQCILDKILRNIKLKKLWRKSYLYKVQFFLKNNTQEFYFEDIWHCQHYLNLVLLKNEFWFTIF